MDEWISTNERLPDENISVLVCDESRDVNFCEVAWLFNNIWMTRDDWSPIGYYKWWMPIPTIQDNVKKNTTTNRDVIAQMSNKELANFLVVPAVFEDWDYDWDENPVLSTRCGFTTPMGGEFYDYDTENVKRAVEKWLDSKSNGDGVSEFAPNWTDEE